MPTYIKMLLTASLHEVMLNFYLQKRFLTLETVQIRFSCKQLLAGCLFLFLVTKVKDINWNYQKEIKYHSKYEEPKKTGLISQKRNKEHIHSVYCFISFIQIRANFS